MFPEQENYVRATRSSSSKKRASSLALQRPDDNNTRNKRVALGDITYSLNVIDSTQKKNPDERKLKKNDSASAAGATRTELTHRSPDTQNSEINKEKCESQLKEIQSINEGFSVGLHSCTYSSSIYKHLRSLEIEESTRPLPNYMESIQNDVSVCMREVLVDWMVDVAEEYKLVSDTLYLSVSCVDRFLSLCALNRNKLQLLGVSCMLVASKYEEIHPPNVEDFCYITDNSYNKEEVLHMEKDVLKLLNFEITTPTIKSFLRIFTRAAQENGKTPDLQFEFLSCYLSELSLLDHRCVQFLQSVIAASAIFLTKFTIQPKMHPWSKTLQCCSGYRPSDLKECVHAIHDWQLNRRGSHLKAVRDKYLQHKYKCVASLSSPSEIPEHYFEANDE